jgi:hypothetical protein
MLVGWVYWMLDDMMVSEWILGELGIEEVLILG